MRIASIRIEAGSNTTASGSISVEQIVSIRWVSIPSGSPGRVSSATLGG
jgi:hypothetical protein